MDGRDELLARCRAGDAGAWRLLVTRYRAHALALAVALVTDRHLAEDAVQAAFLSVVLKLRDLRDDRAFAGWLRQIIRSECARIGSKNAHVDVLHDVEATADTPLLDAELRDAVRAAVRELPEKQRETVELFYLDELSQSAVSEALAIPEGTVRRRLHDARQNLRKALAKSTLPI